MQADCSSPVAQAPNESARLWITRLANVRVVALAAFLIGAAVVLADRPFTHAETGDSSIFDYIAQSIVRGQVPYRDVIDPKGPGSMYLSAGAMAIGRSLGVRDIIAVRWFHVVLMGLLAAITFLVAEKYFQNRFASIFAFMVPFMSGSFSSQVIRGTQPKLPMVLFGMLSLLLIAKEQPFWAGFFSMLSCLCWQPGLMFTGVAVLIFSRYLTSWRDLRAIKVVFGALVPLAVVILYFYLRGALGDLWSWTIVYPLTVFAPETTMAFGETRDHFWLVLQRELQPLSIIAPLALAGLVLYIIERARRRAGQRERIRFEDLSKDALVYPPVIYLIFCMINFQSAPDLIPLYPFIGLFAGLLVVEAVALISRSRPKVASLVSAAVTIVVIVVTVVEHAPGGPVKTTLQDQDREAKVLAGYIEPGDKIYAHGMAEVLVLLNRPNLNKYLALNSGADEFIAARKSGGFQDVIDEIETYAPKIVVMTRLRNVRHRDELNEWVDQHYDKLEFENLKGVYVRTR